MCSRAVDKTCPCGLASPYADCCGRWHAGPLRLRAPDAALLMRSRYTAYVLRDVGYLRETWHPRTRPLRLDPDPPDLHWLGLEVRRRSPQDERHATVEFVARWKRNGRAMRLHETSRFENVDGHWVYVDGTHT